MTLTELSSVEPGERLGVFRYAAGGAVLDSTLNRGKVPKSSSLAEEGAETYIATDNMGRAIAAVAMAHIHDGEADLGIESRDGSLGQHPELFRSVVRAAMERNRVKVGHLDPQLVNMIDIPPEHWKQIGFIHDKRDDGYTFIGA